MDLETIKSESGFDFDSLEDVQLFWDTNKPADAPDFSDDVVPYLRGVRGCDSWPQLQDRTAYTNSITDRLDDVYRAIYPSSIQKLVPQ